MNNGTMEFNGELYNLPELSALAEYGSKFSSFEKIIFRLYKKYGPGMLQYFHGTFALVINEPHKNKVFCARDAFGVKPFYYTQINNEFIYSTEIKKILSYPGFKPVVNTEALGQYLTFQYSVLTETFFKGIFKLPPGHYLVWENNAVKISRYNSHLFTPSDISLDEAVENIDGTVTDSVAKYMVSDEEIGAFLSGGVDSGYVAALFAKNGGKKTFTVGFDYEKYNEIENAKILSEQLGVENISKLISVDEYWESLSKIQYFMEEPLADPAAIAFYFACKEAAKHVKIAFSGEGADEFFGGYNIYKEPLSLRYYTWLPVSLRKWLANLAKKLPGGVKGRGFLLRGAKTVEERFIGNAYIFSPEERNRLLKHKTIQSPEDITRPFYDLVKHENDITKMQFLDIHLWLTEDILLQAEKMSSAHGLKLRVPLMDREVFRVASRLPVKYRVSKKEDKIAFRKAAANHLPAETAQRKKLGFPVPIRIWLRDEKYYKIVKAHFTSEVSEEYFHVNELINLLDGHYNGKTDNSRKIWTVYMFLLWHNEYFR